MRITTAALLLVAFFGLAQMTPDPTRTAGHLNGRLWRAMDPSNKLMFLNAYHEGFRDAGAMCDPVLEDAHWFPLNIRLQEARTGLDEFYAERANLPISIPAALSDVTMKAEGLDPVLIERAIASDRAMAAAAEEKERRKTPPTQR